MAGMKLLMMALVVVVVSVATGVRWVGAQVHHVVGGDRGWDVSSDVASWSSGRTFRIGDKIWFTYSAAQEKIVELRSEEEYEACDVSSPIRMYTDGLDTVPLDEEGIRYFASARPENCKSGLKLHVEVQPQPRDRAKQEPLIVLPTERSAVATAAPPTTPSASAHVRELSYALFGGLLIGYLAL